MEPNDLVLWVESRRALVAGDTLIDRATVSSSRPNWANKCRACRASRSSRRALLTSAVAGSADHRVSSFH